MDEFKKTLNDEALDDVAGGAETGTLSVIVYVVEKGDTLGKLAKRYGTTVNAIMRLNSQIKDKNKIGTGWVLRIPDGWS